MGRRFESCRAHHSQLREDLFRGADNQIISRRKFLAQSASAVALPLAFPPAWSPLAYAFQPSPGPDLHLEPHYRERLPLESMLAKVAPGSDAFISELYAQPVAAALRSWSAGLLQSPIDISPVSASLASDFQGYAPSSPEITTLRADKNLRVFRCRYERDTGASARQFLSALNLAFNEFKRFLIAELQIVSIEGAVPGRLSTRVRFELLGEGKDFYREQRSGEWGLEWVAATANQIRLSRWRALDEVRSRSFAPCFIDITASALGANACYSSQMLRGSDYWRTVLDGASGIDIYGHNGVSVGDIDGDGLDEIYVCQPAGLPNRLFHNRGDGTFEDITERSGAGVLENTACALIADINNDGRQDLIVVRTNGPLLFLNQGGSTLRQAPDAFKFASPPQGTFTGAAIADYDRDGWLDIYFCLYAYYQGTDQYKYPLPYYAAENGPPNFLLRNNRDGTFSDVTRKCGLHQNNTRYSFCCAWNDFNNDGWPDLYVVNDFGRKNLYRNNGDGTFTDIAGPAGVEDVGAGMSVCWFDGDNTGREELYVGNMWTAAGERIANQEQFQKTADAPVRAFYRKHAMGNSLLRPDEKGSFHDLTAKAGVGMGRWSWSSDAFDFDHDGNCDLYVTNGMISGPLRDDLNSFFWRQVVANSPNTAKTSNDYEQGWNAINELIRTDGSWSGYERNVFYLNHGDGTFSDVSGAVGLDFLEDSRAFAVADLDNDGRLEVVLKSRNAPQLRILKNMMDNLPSSICFHLRGRKSNLNAIGTVVTLITEAGRQTRMVRAGSGFLSQHSRALHFGLGENQGAIDVLVRWPSGLEQKFFDLPADHNIWLEEGTDRFSIKPFEPRRKMAASPQASEALPGNCETWLLAPVKAPDFSLPDLSGQSHTLSAARGRPVLLHFWSKKAREWQQNLKSLDPLVAHLQVFALNVDDPRSEVGAELHLSFPLLRCSEDIAAIYNILFRQLFDRHRDLPIPATFLLDEKGEIVKVYQGAQDAGTILKDSESIPRSTAERMSKALPFPGVLADLQFSRNDLSSGSVFFQRGYLEQAEAAFRETFKDEPDSAEALYGIGSVQLKQGKLENARESFNRVVNLRASYPSTLPNAWNNLGLIATRQNQIAEAIPFFQEALKLSPDYQVALDNLGNAFRQQKRWDEARTVLEHAVEVNPDDAEANYSLGMVFAQLDQSDRAGEYLQRAVKLRPAYPEALNNLGILYLRTNQPEKAILSFQDCIRAAPDFDQSYLNLARVFALQHKQDQARVVLLDLLKRKPDNVSAQELLRQLP
jgi:tetratricopeptide (TPR) repeat protein/peroxiredoxin